MNRNSQSLGLLVLLFFLLSLGFPFTHQGMFLDGVIYAAVAKNLALGIGTLSTPFYSQTVFPQFYEHPVLGLYLQSLFFRVLGDAFWVERLYCALLSIMNIGLMYAIAKPSTERLNGFLWCAFFWLLVPLNSIIFKNNMLECLSSTLALFATWLLYRAPLTKILGLPLAALVIVFGVLANGPVGLYPLCIPALVFFCYKKPFKHALLDTLLLSISVCVSAIIVFQCVPGLQVNFSNYWSVQVVKSLNGARGGSRLQLFDIMFKAYHLPILIGVLLIAWRVKGRPCALLVSLRYKFKQPATCFYGCLTLASSLPIAISHRLTIHYLALSAPIFSLFLWSLLQQECRYIESFSIKRLLIAFLLLINLSAFILLIASFGKPYKQHALLHDIKRLTDTLDNKAIVSVSPAIYNAFDPGAYFARYSQVSLENNTRRDFFLSDNKISPAANYQPVELHLKKYHLWRKR